MKPNPARRNIARAGLTGAGAVVLIVASLLLAPDIAGGLDDGFAQWRWQFGLRILFLPAALVLALGALYGAICWLGRHSRSGPIM